MKNLDLNSFGVQELNTQEIKNIDGGSDFTDGLSDCFKGEYKNGKSFWYKVGWALECMAGGCDFANSTGKPFA